jgi:two-component system nitrate/nitrite response regulator NarL
MSGPAAIRIVVIDDHTLFRRGVIALLGQEPGFEVAGEASDAIEGIKVAAVAKPQVVLLDLHMPGLSGVQALASLKEAVPAAAIAMLTVSEDADDLMACLRAGASGYLLKNIESTFLTDAIRRLAAGESVMSPSMTGALMREVGGGESRGEGGAHAPLSPREEEILALIAEGASNKEAARRLHVAESTVKIHVQHILRKLGLASRVQAAVYATERGLVRKS